MKILAALNGTENAFNALKTACLLAKSMRYFVTAFIVDVSGQYTPDLTRWEFVRERIDKEEMVSKHELLYRAGQVGKILGVEVERVISDGDIADEIVNYVSENGMIKLVVMGHSSKPVFAENITRNVVAGLPTPILVTGNVIEAKSILLVLSEVLSDPPKTKEMINYTGKLASSLNAGVQILSVVPDLETYSMQYGHIGDVPKMAERLKRDTDRLYKEYDGLIADGKTTLAGLGIETSARLTQGDPVGMALSESTHHDITIINKRASNSNTDSLSPLANKLLHSHTISTIFMQ